MISWGALTIFMHPSFLIMKLGMTIHAVHIAFISFIFQLLPR